MVLVDCDIDAMVIVLGVCVVLFDVEGVVLSGIGFGAFNVVVVEIFVAKRGVVFIATVIPGFGVSCSVAKLTIGASYCIGRKSVVGFSPWLSGVATAVVSCVPGTSSEVTSLVAVNVKTSMGASPKASRPPTGVVGSSTAPGVSVGHSSGNSPLQRFVLQRHFYSRRLKIA